MTEPILYFEGRCRCCYDVIRLRVYFCCFICCV